MSDREDALEELDVIIEGEVGAARDVGGVVLTLPRYRGIGPAFATLTARGARRLGQALIGLADEYDEEFKRQDAAAAEERKQAAHAADSEALMAPYLAMMAKAMGIEPPKGEVVRLVPEPESEFEEEEPLKCELCGTLEMEGGTAMSSGIVLCRVCYSTEPRQAGEGFPVASTHNPKPREPPPDPPDVVVG